MKKMIFILLMSAFILNNNILIASQDISSTRQYGQDNVVVGTFKDIIGEGEYTIKPDIITTYFQSESKSDTSEGAVKADSETMGKFKEYLISQGVKPENIETVNYKTRKDTKKIIESTKVEYNTELSVLLQNIQNDKLFKVVDFITSEKIDNLNKIDLRTEKEKERSIKERNDYTFSIYTTSDDKNTSKNTAKEKFAAIEKQLRNIGVRNIDITEYTTVKNETPVYKDSISYATENKIKVKFDDKVEIGKIFKYLQGTGISNVDGITYDVSPENRQTGEEKAYEAAMENIYKKAEAALKFGNTQLGDVKIIRDPLFMMYGKVGYGDNGGLSQIDGYNAKFASVKRAGITMIGGDKKMKGAVKKIVVEGEPESAIKRGENSITTSEVTIPISITQEYTIKVKVICSFDIIKNLRN